MFVRIVIFTTILSLPCCYGTDVIDDPIVGEEILVSDSQVALYPGNEYFLTAEYFDKYGISRNVRLNWSSLNNEVASISESGVVTANSPGQTSVRASYKNFQGPLININVVVDPIGVAIVAISSVKTNLSAGEKIVLGVSVTNINGEEIPNPTIEWFSENSTILTVDNSGEVTALKPGIAGIHAKVNGVKSNIIDFTVESTERRGTFVSAGGYQAFGEAVLRVEGDHLVLTLSDDFRTSFALGTFVYLANSTNGSIVRASGYEITQIYTNGAKTFSLNPSIKLKDYKYCIILCKPATVTFGFADFDQ